MSVDLDGFRAWLEGLGYTPATVRKAMQDLRSYSERPELAETPTSYQRARDYWWIFHAYKEYADAKKIKVDLPEPPRPMREKLRGLLGRRRKRINEDKLSIPARDWWRLVEHIEAGGEAADRVLEVMVWTGLRVGDVLRIDRTALAQAFGRDDGLIIHRVKGEKTIVSTVNGARAAWEKLYSRLRGGTAPNVAAATNRSCDPRAEPGSPAYKAVARRFKMHCAAAKVPGQHNLHRTRKTVSIRLREAGASLDDISEVLSHEDVETTKIYTGEYKAQIVAETLKKLRRRTP